MMTHMPDHARKPRRILILGGTTEARLLAGRLAVREGVETVLSLAGRTVDPVAHPVPVRRGGFGGAGGLASYLRENNIGLLIDATHPYAAAISANAAEAAKAAGVRLLALRRVPWLPVEGDRWTLVDDAAAAVQALGNAPRRVLLTLGRQEIGAFAAAAQHSYLIRSVDPVEPPLAVPNATYILARGPFPEPRERTLLAEHGIEFIVAKNSGGSATYGKIAAARALGVEVILFSRPDLPEVDSVGTVEEAVLAVDHWLNGRLERGV